MHRLNLNNHLLALMAVSLVALGAMMFATPRQASAAIPDLNGVFCSHLPTVSGITIVRMDHNFNPTDGDPNDIAFTAVQITPRGSADCQAPGALPAGPLPNQQGLARPTLTGTYNPGTQTLSGTLCQQDLNFGGVVLAGWNKIDIDFTFADPPTNKTVDGDAFTLTTGVDPITCTGGTPLVIGIDEGVWLDGPAASSAGFTSDWDGDGVTDWDELSPASVDRSDPFNPNDQPVGGVAEIAEAAASPLDATASSGTSMWLVAGIAAAAVAGAFGLGGAAVFAKRRVGQ